MKKRSLISILSAVFLLFTCAACGQTRAVQETPNTVPVSIDPYAPVYTQPVGVPLTTEDSLEPDLPPLEFNEDAATYLGAFNSEIYGRLVIYYQQDRLAVIDPLGDLLFTLYAEGYHPDGAEEREAFLTEETETDENGDPVTKDPYDWDDDDYDWDDEDEDEYDFDDPYSPGIVEQTGGYSEGEIQLLAGDVNFDGYTDFMLLHARGTFNTYYFCWLWDMAAHTFKYYLPLSSIPSPTFDMQNKRIISSDRRSTTLLLTTDYIWQNGELVPVGHGEYSLPEQTTRAGAAEDVDTSVTISDGKLLSYIEFNTNKDSSCRWICKIENQAVLRLYSDTPNKNANIHRFTFRGVSVGTTTVAFRYSTGWDAGFVAERIFNVTVGRDGRITIRITG